MHLHGAFDRAQVEFIVPTRAIEHRQIFFRRLLRIQQRRHDHEGPGPESTLCDSNERFSNRDVLRQRLVRLPIQRANGRRLQPADDVVVRTQALPTSEVGRSIGFVQAPHIFDPALFKLVNVQPIGHQTIG